MTQLTFDFTGGKRAELSSACGGEKAHTPINRISAHLEPLPAPKQTRSNAEKSGSRTAGQVATHGSLPLYDPQRGEIHHMGDLAQQVLARYDIVRRRRQARLAREAARRQVTA